MLAAVLLFAQDAAKGDPAAAPGIFSTPLLPMMLIFGALWFIVILPAQRKERKQRETVLGTLKKNDEVLTSSGIIGVVQNLREGEDEVTIKIDDNCKVRMKKSSIVQILKAKDSAAESTGIQPGNPR